jgi:hypothetical protein
MNRRRILAALLICLFASANLFAKQQEDFRSGAIKTSYGFLLVWNGTTMHYTLEIRGKNVRQTSTERKFFSVDGMFLQIVEAQTSNFVEDAQRQKMSDKVILEMHRDWELKYLEGEYKEKLKVESSWQKLSNGKDALLWHVDVPQSTGSNVKKQIYLTVLPGDYVLMLGGVETDTIAVSATSQLLLATAGTLKASDKPIDLQKMQEAIRKETSGGGAN